MAFQAFQYLETEAGKCTNTVCLDSRMHVGLMLPYHICPVRKNTRLVSISPSFWYHNQLMTIDVNM